MKEPNLPYYSTTHNDAPMNKISILIVEDEGIVAENLSDKLKQLGYQVAGIASRGEEAREIALKLRPQLILMDIQLDEQKDGIWAAEAIQREYDVPVIYLTAHSDPATLARAKVTGPLGYVLKPFETRDLTTQIELALYRHQAEQQLREQRELLRVTLTSIGDAVIATDAQGLITFMNPVAETLTGWPMSQATGRPMAEVFHIVNEYSRVIVDDPVSKVLKTGLIVGLANHTILLQKDGGEVPIDDSGAPILDKHGNILGVVLVFRDITERKQAEEVLQESEEKYRTVADFTYNMETWRTPDDKYRYVSPSCERITGHTVAEFLADPNLLIKITHPDDQSKVIEHFLEANHGAGTQNMGIDFRILTPGGTIRWLGHSSTVVHGRGGLPLGRRESYRNITIRKQAEEQKEKLEIQNRQLQKVKSLGRMAGAIAHHFNNKLFVVMANLELALKSPPQDNTITNALTAALQSADKAAEVGRLMLTYLGQATGTREPLDLSEICRRSLPLIQATIPKNVILGTDLLSPGPTITANSNQIQMILNNLISNSSESVGDAQGIIQLTEKNGFSVLHPHFI